MAGRLKKAVSVLIAVCLAVVVLPVTASAVAMVNPAISSSAKTVKPNQAVEMTISLEGIPYTGRVIPNDVILVVDRSGSMGGKDAAMKAAAKTFVTNLDLTTHKVGVVDYADGAEGMALSTDKTALMDYIDAIPSPNGGTAMDKGIEKAVELLQKKRPTTSGAIVLMTDGEPNSKDNARNAAAAAKAQGYVFYTVALTSGEDSDANKFLKEIATSDTDHYSVFATSQLNSVYTSIASKIGACNARDVIVEQTISSQFEYVAGSGDNSIPKPTVSGNKLRWEFPQLSKGVSSVSFKLRAKEVAPGSYKPCFGNVSYTDYNNSAQVISLHASNITIEAVPKVTGLTATAGNKQVTVSWNAVSGAERYRVCVFRNGKIYRYANVSDGTTTTTIVTNLVNGTKYGFWVQAYINGGYDADPDTANLVYATPKAAPVVIPDTPQNLTAVPGNKQVELSWDAVSGVTEYRVCVFKGTSIYKYITVSGATTTTVTGLVNGTKYGFWVQSYTTRYSADPDTTNLVYATPKAPDTRPATPANLTAVPGNKSVKLTWDPVAGATSYRVCVFRNGSIYRYVPVSSGTTITVPNLINGTKYGFWVQSYTDKYSKDPDKAGLVYATPKAVNNKPATPANLKAVAGNKSVTLTWDSVAGATQYKVSVYRNGSLYRNVPVSSGTSVTVTGLQNGTRYGFWVQSYTTQYSADPNTANLVYATPKAANSGKPATPTIISVTPGSRSVTVAWNSVPGATAYRVCILRNGAVYRYANATAAETYKVITNLVPGTEYGIWVQAYTTQYSEDPDPATAKKFTPLA